MHEITISTHLKATPDTVGRYLMMPALLNYVVRGVMTFEPVEPAAFPARWAPGRYRVRLLAGHVLPLGSQVIGIEFPGDDEAWFLRHNGQGSIARVWDHRIFIEPEGSGTRYVDRVRIDAGFLSWPVSLFAALFYRYRQRRWRKLVALEFAPLAGANAALDPPGIP